MPVLAAYIGAHDVTGLIYKSSEEYTFWNYPYVYSPELFSAFTTETSFYRALFDQMCKDVDLKLSDCDVILSGFLEPPKIDLGLKMYISMYELLLRTEQYYPIMINNYAVATKDQIFSSKPLQYPAGETQDPVEEDFAANLSLYPQVVVSDLVSRVEMDSKLLQTVQNFKVPAEKPIVFLGCRFNTLHGIEDVNTMLILQLLQGTGAYDIFVDSNDSTILTNLLRIYLGKDPGITVHPEKLATLISIPSGIECLIASQIGTSQIIDLEKDKIFVLPLPKEERTKIMLKPAGNPQVERIVSGGKSGLIFDTRTGKTDFASAYRQYSSFIRSAGGDIK
ncbi:hypothetical protein GYA27_02560 [candidate division WWE3 bacterium]|uniref:Uncharacterized protein n=1 Tax=candidate division WWE3 bacterium TaxID=2053526 RepID=A0A7X9DKV8_UNCKA|nr:hypothetical protein [candidate division WWE3 bacterium]